MKAINLYFLSRVREESMFSDYENYLTRRDEYKRSRKAEQESVCSMVDQLLSCSCLITYKACDGFFFSYVIDHISKEFDLVKVAEDKSKVLNIELKSMDIGTERIAAQLRQNRYYLRHITRNIFSFTYVSQTQKVYTLDGEGILQETAMENLAEVMNGFGDFMPEGIETLFSARDFLVSPLTTPARFLSGSYFLTDQQRDFSHKIHEELSKAKRKGCLSRIIALSGSSGTGKTLLVYDLAKSLSEDGPVLFVHCGSLSRGHQQLNEHMERVTICGAENYSQEMETGHYPILIVDESQRLEEKELDRLRDHVLERGIFSIFSFAVPQVLNADPEVAAAAEKISLMADASYMLTSKIRINKEIYLFLKGLFDFRKRARNHHFNNIDLIYADSRESAEPIIDYYKERGYMYISCDETEDTAEKPMMVDSDDTFGQEYDHVMVTMDSRFYHDEKGILRSSETSPGPYSYEQMLYQAVTRTREQLCILVCSNEDLMRRILTLLKY